MRVILGSELTAKFPTTQNSISVKRVRCRTKLLLQFQPLPGIRSQVIVLRGIVRSKRTLYRKMRPLRNHCLQKLVKQSICTRTAPN